MRHKYEIFYFGSLYQLSTGTAISWRKLGTEIAIMILISIRKYLVSISAGSWPVITEFFRGFPRFLKTKAG
jgi:hypothetical protein